MTEEQLGLNTLGLNDIKPIHRNLPVERLIEDGLLNGEVVMGMNGATIVDTGAYTGRSPKDKYFVEESSSVNNLWWGPVNRPVDEAIFDELYAKIIDYYNNSFAIVSKRYNTVFPYIKMGTFDLSIKSRK